MEELISSTFKFANFVLAGEQMRAKYSTRKCYVKQYTCAVSWHEA